MQSQPKNLAERTFRNFEASKI